MCAGHGRDKLHCKVLSCSPLFRSELSQGPSNGRVQDLRGPKSHLMRSEGVRSVGQEEAASGEEEGGNGMWKEGAHKAVSVPGSEPQLQRLRVPFVQLQHGTLHD